MEILARMQNVYSEARQAGHEIVDAYQEALDAVQDEFILFLAQAHADGCLLEDVEQLKFDWMWLKSNPSRVMQKLEKESCEAARPRLRLIQGLG